MVDSRRPMRDFAVKVIATFFGIGYIAFIPATWASAAAAILAWFMGGTILYWTAAFCLAGFWACGPSRAVFRSKDPKHFVMDEVCGMLIGLLWIPQDVRWYAAGFFLFRFYDVWKPGPIGRLDKLEHPSGIVWDDLLAGVFTNLTLQIALRIFVW